MTMTQHRDTPAPATPPSSSLSTPRVVVAVDTRPSSFEALAWAADEALVRGLPLRIVTAFAGSDRCHVPRSIEHAMEVQRRLQRRVRPSRPWIEEAELVVRRGSVPALLAEAAGCADILVVGGTSRVGATDPACRPICPVVVVPVQPAAPADG